MINELVVPELPFIKRAISKSAEFTSRRGYGELSSSTVRRLALKFNQKVLGCGRDSIVLPYPGEPEKVFGLWYQSQSNNTITQDNALFIYHWHHILSKVFPFNFPEIFAARGAPIGETTIRGTVRQRVYQSRQSPLHPFQAIEPFLWDLPLDYENNSSNIAVSKVDRGEYYLDIVEPLDPTDTFEERLLKENRKGRTRFLSDLQNIYGVNNVPNADFSALLEMISPSVGFLEEAGHL